MSKPNSANVSQQNKNAAASSSPPVHVQEFPIRLPKNMKKVHHVMRFNATLKVDFAEWKNVKMERENNMRDVRADEAMPKFGAGSEYNRDLKEELRRKRLGITARKYKPDAQPWILRVGGKNGKKFRGSREGGVGEHASFYIFAHATDGSIEAYPLHEWYNFQSIQRYKALSAEEAEQEFGRRNRTMNYFSLMMQKRLKGDDGEGSAADAEEPKLPGKKSKELRITDVDDVMMDSDDESDGSDDGGKKREDSDSENTKKKGKKNMKKKPKKQRDSDDEAFEDSDDGDEEGREVDYIESSSDESDPEIQADKQMKSVAEEDGLRKLLTSDEDSDEENNSSDESNKEEKKESTENENKTNKKKKLNKKSKDDGKKDSLTDLSSDSSDSDTGSKKKGKLFGNSASNSRSASPSLDGNSSMAGSSGIKRKMSSMPTDLIGGNSNGASENSNSPSVTPAKKAKYDTPQVPTTFTGIISGNKDDNGITEDAVRRYLMRKPMTTKELLTKFKNKKTGLSGEKLIETMTQILKKIKPDSQRIQGIMYLSIKNK